MMFEQAAVQRSDGIPQENGVGRTRPSPLGQLLSAAGYTSDDTMEADAARRPLYSLTDSIDSDGMYGDGSGVTGVIPASVLDGGNLSPSVITGIVSGAVG